MGWISISYAGNYQQDRSCTEQPAVGYPFHMQAITNSELDNMMKAGLDIHFICRQLPTAAKIVLRSVKLDIHFICRQLPTCEGTHIFRFWLDIHFICRQLPTAHRRARCRAMLDIHFICRQLPTRRDRVWIVAQLDIHFICRQLPTDNIGVFSLSSWISISYAGNYQPVIQNKMYCSIISEK